MLSTNDTFQQKLKSLVFEKIQEGISISDENGIILFTNPAEDRMFGYDSGELVGKHVTIQNAYPPNENEYIVKGVIGELKAKGFWNGQWHNRKKDGSTFYSESFITMINVENVNVFLCVQRDLTEQMRTEEALRQSEKKWQLLANAVPSFVWAADNTGLLYYFNDHWYNYTGLTKEESIGTGWVRALHPDDVPGCLAIWNNAREKEIPYEVEVRYRSSKGEYRWSLGRALPVKDSKGVVTDWYGISTDIHEQKTLSQKLEALVTERTKELQRSNEDLQQFAHAASHDLKEPLRKIRTFTSRVNNEFSSILPEKVKTYLSKVESSSDRMNSMIEGLLAYASLEGVEQKIDEINLNELIGNIESDLEVIISQKAAIIQRQELPVIEGSGVLIHQLFYNLINNSLKFSRSEVRPVISITSTVVEVDEEQIARIVLSDNGIGFESEHSEIIFDTFTRLNVKDKYEGTGLGLSLCRKIVKRHGGLISAYGNPNEGASFTIDLPLKQVRKSVNTDLIS